MTVQIWVGEIPEHSQEREAIVALARGLARLDELYLVLANFTVGGQAVDLAIFKHNGGFVIELKHCDGKVIGGVNGKWQVIGANGEVHVVNPDRRNPYNQVISYFYRLSNYLNPRRAEFLSEHRAAGVDFRTCKRLVVIAPYVHPESEIVLDWKVDLKGLDELPTYLVTNTSSGIDLTEEEMLAIPRLLRCEPWRDVNLLVAGEAGVEAPAAQEALPAAAASAAEAEPLVAVTPAAPARPTFPRWLLRAGIAAVALVALVAVAWGTGVWQAIWPLATPSPQPTTAIILPTIDPATLQTPQPLIEQIEQPVPRESAFAGGWVTVTLRTVEYQRDRIALRWALENGGTRPVEFPLNSTNIAIKDNLGNAYQVDEALSEPAVLRARPGERVEGTSVVPRAVSPDAWTLTIYVIGKPYEERHVWLTNVTGR